MDSFGRVINLNNPNSFHSTNTSSAIAKQVSSSSVEISTYFYTSSNNLISPHALGQIRYNNLEQTKATQIHISYTTADFIDVTFLLNLSPKFSKIYIQDKLYGTPYIEYIVDAIIDNNTFITVSVSVLRSNVANISFTNLLEVILRIIK